jgi:hypothetical protein
MNHGPVGADTPPMNCDTSRWKLLLLTILVIALAIALAKVGNPHQPPVTGMWDGPR